jgi:CubicO group peptidase (beta-lactamase class C family)
LLVGLAISEGRLHLAEKVEVVLPGFESSAFGKATIEDLLRMTSGVALKNSYERGITSDNRETNPMISPGQENLRFLREKKELNRAGKVFDYNGAVTAMLGAVLRDRTGRTNTEYLEEKLWQPMGASDPGYWIKNRNGEEGVQGQFVATLRDYARLGLLVMNMGKAGGANVVPAAWIADMVAVRTDRPQSAGAAKYGLHIWIPQAAGGRSMMLGTNGQAIFIDPIAQTVIVHTANSPHAEYDGNTHLFPLRDAIVQTLSGAQP